MSIREPSTSSRRGKAANSPPPSAPRHDRDQHGRHDRDDQDNDAPSHTTERPLPNTGRFRFLSPAEWSILAHGVGGVEDAEAHAPCHPCSFFWPPRNMPRGLYKDVVSRRMKFFYLYHGTSSFRWLFMILQLLIGATLTAIGSVVVPHGTPVTVLGAVNTVIAGLLALLHNTGLPDRYRHNMDEFGQVQDHIRGLLDTGIVPAEQTVNQVLANCFDLYQNAKATVSANLPVNYNSGQAVWAARQSSMVVPSRPSSRILASGGENHLSVATTGAAR